MGRGPDDLAHLGGGEIVDDDEGETGGILRRQGGQGCAHVLTLGRLVLERDQQAHVLQREPIDDAVPAQGGDGAIVADAKEPAAHVSFAAASAPEGWRPALGGAAGFITRVETVREKYYHLLTNSDSYASLLV